MFIANLFYGLWVSEYFIPLKRVFVTIGETMTSIIKCSRRIQYLQLFHCERNFIHYLIYFKKTYMRYISFVNIHFIITSNKRKHLALMIHFN